MRIRSLLLGVILCVAGLAGCTTGHDLPTISGAPSASDTSTSYLEVTAETYYQCMTNAGITVDLMTNQAGQNNAVQFSNDYELVEWRDQNGEGHVRRDGDNNDPDYQKRVDDYVSSIGDPYELILDGVNYSEAYKRCMTESGYDDDAAWKSFEWTNDPEYMQSMVDVSNRWAQCARNNGWPDVQDISMPDDLSVAVSVQLPWSITEDQLRQLLDVCPNTDDQDPDIPPSIDFAVPHVAYDSNGMGKAILEKYNALYTILTETRNASPSGNPT